MKPRGSFLALNIGNQKISDMLMPGSKTLGKYLDHLLFCCFSSRESNFSDDPPVAPTGTLLHAGFNSHEPEACLLVP